MRFTPDLNISISHLRREALLARVWRKRHQTIERYERVLQLWQPGGL